MQGRVAPTPLSARMASGHLARGTVVVYRVIAQEDWRVGARPTAACSHSCRRCGRLQSTYGRGRGGKDGNWQWVNIATWVESIAPPRGIAVTATGRDHVGN